MKNVVAISAVWVACRLDALPEQGGCHRFFSSVAKTIVNRPSMRGFFLPSDRVDYILNIQ